MFSILNNNYQLNLSAHKVKNILGILCYKKKNEIKTDLKNISKLIQINNGIKLPLLNSLISENDNNYYSAIFAEIFINELIFCIYNIQFIKLNIESYCEKNKNNINRDNLNTYKYEETLPITNRDVLLISNKLEDNVSIGLNILYKRLNDFLKKLGNELSFDTYVKYDINLHLFNRFVISIVSAMSNKPSPTHGQFIGDFEELFNISQNVWSMISIITYTDIFGFMMKNYDTPHNYNILSKKVNSFQVKMGKSAVSYILL